MQRYATKQAAEDAANGAGEDEEEEEEESESEEESDDEDEAAGDSKSHFRPIRPAQSLRSDPSYYSGIMTALQQSVCTHATRQSTVFARFRKNACSVYVPYANHSKKR